MLKFSSSVYWTERIKTQSGSIIIIGFKNDEEELFTSEAESGILASQIKR